MSNSNVRSQIASVNEQFMAAFARRDAAGIAGFYATDALLLPPDSQQVRGSAGIRTFWDGILNLGVEGVRLETAELEEHGDDTAIEVGKAAILGPGGAIVDQGKYLVVWKKEGGSWKLHRDIWNSNGKAGG